MHFTYAKDKEFIKYINIFNLPYNLYPMTEERYGDLRSTVKIYVIYMLLHNTNESVTML